MHEDVEVLSEVFALVEALAYLAREQDEAVARVEAVRLGRLALVEKEARRELLDRLERMTGESGDGTDRWMAEAIRRHVVPRWREVTDGAEAAGDGDATRSWSIGSVAGDEGQQRDADAVGGGEAHGSGGATLDAATHGRGATTLSSRRPA